jgi:hypothetical protein
MPLQSLGPPGGGPQAVHQEVHLLAKIADSVSRYDIDIGGFEELEASTYVEHRWWSVTELAQTTEQVVPNGLVHLLSELLTGRQPRLPVRLPWHH